MTDPYLPHPVPDRHSAIGDPFTIVNTDRSSHWPRYRLLASGDAQALIAIHADQLPARLVRDDHYGDSTFETISSEALRAAIDDPNAPIPSQPAVAVTTVRVDSSTSYRIVTSDSPPSPDIENGDGAGEWLSLLTHPHTPRGGTHGLDAWTPRPSTESPPSLDRAIRVRLDRSVFGRRASARMYICGDARERMPVVVMLDGDVWSLTYDAPTALATRESCVLVMVPAPSEMTRRATEYASSEHANAVGTGLLAAIDAALAEQTIERAGTILVGQSMSGYAATRAALRTRDIDVVVAASPSMWWPPHSPDEPLAGIAGGDLVSTWAATSTAHDSASSRTAFHFTVGVHEQPMHRHVRAAADALEHLGHTATVQVVPGGHDHAQWRLQLPHSISHALAHLR